MDKKADNEKNTENIEEKVLIFNPAGFAAKLVVSIAAAVFMTKGDYDDGNLLYAVFNSIATFAIIYVVASFFGFLVRLTRNYLVAAVLFIAACFGYAKLYDLFGSGIVFNVIATIVLIVVLANDIRKAVLHFKHVV